MARPQESYGKIEKEKKRLKKRQAKELKREERRTKTGSTDFESMIAYVDEFGNITDTPPDPTKKKKIDAKSIEISIPKREKEAPPSPFKKGRVDFFNHDKGFGFIKETDSDEKHFVHVHGLIDDIEENDHVTYELEKGMKGMNAVRVKKI